MGSTNQTHRRLREFMARLLTEPSCSDLVKPILRSNRTSPPLATTPLVTVLPESADESRTSEVLRFTRGTDAKAGGWYYCVHPLVFQQTGTPLEQFSRTARTLPMAHTQSEDPRVSRLVRLAPANQGPMASLQLHWRSASGTPTQGKHAESPLHYPILKDKGTRSPVYPTNVESIERTRDLILLDRRVTINKVEHCQQISHGSAYEIILNKLGFNKVYVRWVPKQLTQLPKQQRMDISQKN
ncbi:hypothetical protein LAZ67_7001531 [Cordylochernes scorpioides]|uniref:Uncharacterized protein n=1 Tax=Cordylochernes scorpioides TaxID=51811 RepID=A0ABY6KMX6_9ARAC|nr:hypothetical protein LAZ67_7001531 [Cordylochernes scorpioides]